MSLTRPTSSPLSRTGALVSTPSMFWNWTLISYWPRATLKFPAFQVITSSITATAVTRAPILVSLLNFIIDSPYSSIYRSLFFGMVHKIDRAFNFAADKLLNNRILRMFDLLGRPHFQ